MALDFSAYRAINAIKYSIKVHLIENWKFCQLTINETGSKASLVAFSEYFDGGMMKMNIEC